MIYHQKVKDVVAEETKESPLYEYIDGDRMALCIRDEDIEFYTEIDEEEQMYSIDMG